MTVELTYENFQQVPSPMTGFKTFSKVSSLLHLLCKMTIEPIFVRYHRLWLAAAPRHIFGNSHTAGKNSEKQLPTESAVQMNCRADFCGFLPIESIWSAGENSGKLGSIVIIRIRFSSEVNFEKIWQPGVFDLLCRHLSHPSDECKEHAGIYI